MNALLQDRESFVRKHWALLPILGVAVLLRLWQIHESLWLDELHTAWVVADGPAAISERARLGNQSPLYFYLPYLTTGLLGTSEWTLRLPSLLAGSGLVALAYLLSYRWTQSLLAAALVGALVAVDRNFLFYATEARPYALVQLMAVTQLWLFWELQSRSALAPRLGFVASTVGMFYLHYTAILLVAGEVMFWLIQRGLGRATAYRTRQFAADLLFISVLMLPSFGHLREIGSHRHAWAAFIGDTSLQWPLHWFSLDNYVIVPLIGLAVTTWFFRQTQAMRITGQQSTCAMLLANWLLLPVAIVWVSTVTDFARLYLLRYVIGAALAPILFAGLCVGACPTRRARSAVAVVTFLAALVSSGIVQQFRIDGRLFGDRQENWREAVAWVNSAMQPSSPVFIRSGLLEADRLREDSSPLLRDYCLLPVTSIYALAVKPHDLAPLPTANSGDLSAGDLDRIAATGWSWFIIHGGSRTRERFMERVQASLQSRGLFGMGVQDRQFGNVAVWQVVPIPFKIDSRAEGLPTQPTSPNSIAPP